VQDLSDVYLALVTAAMQPGGGKATWNDKGYYYTESGEFFWGDIGREIAKAAKKHGYIESDEVDRLSPDEVDKVMPNLQNGVGMNSRARAVRARKLLGWSPKQKSLVDVLPDIVDLEAKGLGIAKGHAAKAAGEA
jgi:nucleoside-diphosphate-sugar epimerase